MKCNPWSSGLEANNHTPEKCIMKTPEPREESNEADTHRLVAPARKKNIIYSNGLELLPSVC
jgi:hypothetical protein